MADSVETAVASSPRARVLSWLGVVAGHRLTHFSVIGAVLFAIAPSPNEQRTIHLDARTRASLHAEAARRLKKNALTDEEARGVEIRFIEDELLHREASRLRLGEGDAIIRQRLLQKLLVLAEDVDGASQPLRGDELTACFSETRERWKWPATKSFVHVFGSTRDAVASLREQAMAFSAVGGHEREIPPFGQSFSMNRRVLGATVETIEQSYGHEFASAMGKLSVGTWSEPIASKYGWHLVRVIEVQSERPATIDDVRRELALECQVRRRKRAVRDYVQRLFSQYEVYVEGERIREFAPSSRTAQRTEPSGED